MKFLTYTFLFATTALLFSCNTDFSVNGEYEERPIVHAIIDANDTIHYFKINKTFLGDGNALEFAQVPDSSYFNSVEGTITELVNGNEVRQFTLRDTIIENKSEGVFYAPEQKIYYFRTPDNNKLNPDALLKMELNLNNGKHIVKGETQLVKNIQVTDPNGISSLSFADPVINDDSNYKNEAFKFTEGENAVVFDFRIIFTYNETTNAGTVTKDIEWKIGQQDLESATLGLFRVNGIQFYEFIRNNISPDEDVIKRTVESMTFKVTGGSEDLQNYILVSQPTSNLAQSKPTFTNLEGGLGIFTSRMTDSYFRTAFQSPNTRILHVNSTRQLCEGEYTGDLKFCSDIINDQTFSFYCN